MKNILLPTDFSTASWNAIAFALLLFAEKKCTFYVLNAYTPEIHSNRLMAGSGSTDLQPKSAQSVSEKGLQKMVEQMKKKYKNPLHKYVKIASFSLLLEEVKDAVTTHHIDFIIMGASGSANDDTIFMGRNTVRVLNNIDNCPVLAIPKTFKFQKLSAITLVIDTNYYYTGKELNPLLTLATIFNSNIEILNLNNTPGYLTKLQQLNLETIGKKLDNISHNFHDLPNCKTLVKTLGDFIDQARCQLLVVSNNTEGFIKNLRGNFVVEHSEISIDVPILSLQTKVNNVSFIH